MSEKPRRRRRTREEIYATRLRVAQLKRAGYSDGEVAAQLERETGITVSRRQVNVDVHKMRKEMRDEGFDQYEQYLEEEKQRLDMLEAAIWKAIADSAGGTKRVETERIVVAPKDEKGNPDYTQITPGEEILRIAREVETLELDGVPPILFDQLNRVQQERRKLLGLYPQKQEETRTIEVKTYQMVSPDDWPAAPELPDHRPTIVMIPDHASED